MIFDFSKIEGFDWDKGNYEHIKKHDVKTEECEELFFNKPFILSKDETHSQVEERFRVYGRTNSKRQLFIIFTVRSNKFRVISARDQNKKERTEFKKVGGEKH